MDCPVKGFLLRSPLIISVMMAHELFNNAVPTY